MTKPPAPPPRTVTIAIGRGVSIEAALALLNAQQILHPGERVEVLREPRRAITEPALERGYASGSPKPKRGQK